MRGVAVLIQEALYEYRINPSFLNHVPIISNPLQKGSITVIKSI